MEEISIALGYKKGQGCYVYETGKLLEAKGILPSKQHFKRRENLNGEWEKYDTNELQNLVDTSDSLSEIGRKLGLKGYSNTARMKKFLDVHGIDYSSLRSLNLRNPDLLLRKGTNVNRETLLYLIELLTGKSSCFRCGNLGMWNGRELHLQVHHKNGDHTDNRLENLQILCPNCHATVEGRGFEKSQYATIKRDLIGDFGRKCCECDLETFESNPIPLELHHKSGNHQDDRYENIALICPNCHSQTETFAGRNQTRQNRVTDKVLLDTLMNVSSINQALKTLKLPPALSYYERANKLITEHDLTHLRKDDKYLSETVIPRIIEYLHNNDQWDLYDLSDELNISIRMIREVNQGTHRLSPNGADYPIRDIPTRMTKAKYCACGGIIRDKKQNECLECAKKRISTESARGNFPTKKKLKELIRTKSFQEIARMFKVSGTAIAKWCQTYNLPSKKKYIRQISDKEWEALDVFDEEEFLAEHPTITRRSI